ncbi:MAG: polysaccharide deacetylase family protein [Armatimonadetes bacterium]|nr:polysaccharide deacetylase family protein [Armatimonadota bacterium]
MRNFRRRAPLAVAAVAVLGLAAWQADRYRKVPLDRAINPLYWVRHWRGEDRYDPRTGLLEHGDPNAPEVALTVDDGPDPRYGPAIAALLERDHVPATFFLVGTRVKQYPQVARLLARGGFEIGNHTYDHQRLPALPPHQIANELRLCDRWVAAVTGRHTTLLRPPGVQYNDKVLQVARSLGYVTVSWTVGAGDYDPHPPQWIARRVLDRTEPGSIILLHQDTPATLAALPAIISGLRARGYRFVTVGEMLRRLHVPVGGEAATAGLTKPKHAR